MPIGFLTSPHLSKSMNNGTKTNKGSKHTALPQAGKSIYFIKISLMTQSQIKLTLNPKLELPWIMISLCLLMSRVVTYKMTWHRKPLHEEVQVNTNN